MVTTSDSPCIRMLPPCGWKTESTAWESSMPWKEHNRSEH
jgi:hypothetical protein